MAVFLTRIQQHDQFFILCGQMNNLPSSAAGKIRYNIDQTKNEPF